MGEEEIKLAIATNNKRLLSETPLDFEFGDGTQILHWAAFFGNRRLVELLIKSGVDLEKKGGKYLSSPIFFATYNKNYHIMNLLIEKCVNVNDTNTLLWTPLHICAYNNDILGFILLLCHGADLCTFDNKKRTPFGLAKSRSSGKVIGFERLHNQRTNIKRIGASKEDAVFIVMLLLYLAVLYSYSFVLVLTYMLVLSKVLVRCKFIVIFNVMFFVTIIFAIGKTNGQLLYLVYRYILLYWQIRNKRLRHARRNTLEEAAGVVSCLLKENNYNEKAFCYTCMTKKDKTTRHCSICNVCIERASYHCLFFERCVGMKDSCDLLVFILVTIYIFFAIKRGVRYSKFLCSIVSIIIVVASMLALSIVCKYSNRLLCSGEMDNNGKC